MKNLNFISFALFLLAINPLFSQEQKKEYVVTGLGFYNLENLFDTLIDPDANKILQEDFTPKGQKGWTSERYQEKLKNMSKVIAEIGTDVTPDGLAIIGVAEVENRSVLEDLVLEESIKKRGYKVVHYDSPDKRGIDVGLLYNPKYFKVTSSRSVSLRTIDTTFYTRDQLLVSGLLNGEKIHVIVAHWPSRRGGEKRSKPRRASAAKLGRMIVDSLQKTDPNVKVFYMGDLNDDPTDESVKKHLRGIGKEEKVQKGDLYNPWESYYKKGIGTLAYRDVWNLFDQILVSESLLGKDYSSFKLYKSKIFSKAYLKNSIGRYKGYPYRSFAGGTYVAGYSDHFPVYMFLIKELK
ncbi:MAG: endonuclease/exonuclease/phosphatase family protein [Flavobacteriales bacterium]|nr:endonuclease/exonuclease/phosphatase family protein [Flavobacteriales bacterium]